MRKVFCRVGLAVLAGVVCLWLAMPARAALTLSTGQAVAGLEPQPGEGPLVPRLSDVDHAAQEWFWYRVAAEGLQDGQPEDIFPAVEDLAAVLATEAGTEWPLGGPGASASAVEAIIQTTGARGHHGAVLEHWTDDISDWERDSFIGLRVGVADGGPVVPQTATLSFMGGGMVLGWVVRRRRA